MKVKEFCKLASWGEQVQVESAYNGKILCKNFKEEKHTEIAETVVCSVSTAIRLGYHKNYASSYLRVMVCGDVEYEKENAK
jgi:hypothetical protein